MKSNTGVLLRLKYGASLPAERLSRGQQFFNSAALRQAVHLSHPLHLPNFVSPFNQLQNIATTRHIQ